MIQLPSSYRRGEEELASLATIQALGVELDMTAEAVTFMDSESKRNHWHEMEDVLFDTSLPDRFSTEHDPESNTLLRCLAIGKRKISDAEPDVCKYISPTSCSLGTS